MALSTYSDLQTSVATWMARSDLASYIPDFVTVFEAFFNRTIRVRRMETTVTLTPDASGVASIPADFLEQRRLTWIGTTRRELEFVSPAYLSAINPSLQSDAPRYWTIEGGSIKVTPLSTTNLELEYYAKLPALSGTENWLMAQHPDIYLFGTLAEGYAFIKNPEAASLWQQRRDDALASLVRLDVAAKAPAAMRIMDAYTP